MLKRTEQWLEMTISTMSKKMERMERELPSQVHPLGGVWPNRQANLQLNSGMLAAPTRPASENMALLPTDTTKNVIVSSAATPGASSSFQRSSGVTISTPPTSTGSSASIRRPLTALTNTGVKPSKAEHPRLPSTAIKKENLQPVDVVY